jgi:uncharacterized protein YndB with AHSA1/START domain
VKAAEVARVTTFVAVEPRDAFEVFTQETDLWWRRGTRHRFGGDRSGTLRFEPGAGGRLVEVFDAPGSEVHEVGKIILWEPGKRLVFDWRSADFAPGESTRVEVVFEPEGDGTRVTLEHRGWESIGADHPSRKGLGRGPAFTAFLGLRWGDLVTGLRAHVQARGRTAVNTR